MTAYVNRPEEIDPRAPELDYDALDVPADAPTDIDEAPAKQDVHVEVASQWQLMWWKFRQHKLALLSGVVIILFYLVAGLCEFVAPWHFTTYNSQYVNAPPQSVRLFHDGAFLPHINGYTFERNERTLRRTFTIDEEAVIPLGLFVRGDDYRMWRLFPAQRHLFGPREAGQPFYLLGTDRVGRDVFSRILYSSRVSLTIGLVGVAFSLTIGILLGGISGLLGGWLDTVVQRLIEVVMSIPTIPIWLAIAAMVPIHWGPGRVYFMITVILSLVGWTGMARVVRSKFLALREEDFVLAAELDGVSRYRLITRHMLPSFLSHIIASMTLAVPAMILGETALSFLGIGLRPPVVSWGVMLQDAQRVAVISLYPWLLFPGLAVFIVVLAFNFFGDGLRDAADPYN